MLFVFGVCAHMKGSMYVCVHVELCVVCTDMGLGCMCRT